jgi:integrase
MPRKTKKQTRRGNGEGGIYQRKDGRWCGQVTVGYDEDGKQKKKTMYGKTRDEVAKKVIDASYRVNNGTLAAAVQAEPITVGRMLDSYLWTFKKPAVSDVTFEGYLNDAKIHIIPEFGEVRVDSLTTTAIQQFLNDKHYKQGLSVRSVKGIRSLLNQAYAHAILSLKLVTVNPVSGTNAPKLSRVKSERKEPAKAISVNERAAILKAAENDLRMRAALTTLMLTGIRVGEWLAMTWGQVDFQNGIITIDRALTRVCEYDESGELTGRAVVVGDTKTYSSVRKLKVTPVVTDVLREWREALPGHMRSKKTTAKLLAPDAVVFPNDLGQMRTYNGFRTTYRRFMDKHRLGNYSLHCFRHTFATMYLESGINPKVVQKLLGHKDIETTLRIYSHVLPETFDKAADVMTALHANMMAGDGISQSTLRAATGTEDISSKIYGATQFYC